MFFQNQTPKSVLLLTTGTAIKLHAPPAQPVPLLLANAAFFSGKVKCMHAWILHEEKEGNIYRLEEHPFQKKYLGSWGV